MKEIFTMTKVIIKRNLRIGTLSGLERFKLFQITLPDRVPIALVAGNIEPYLIDEKFNYKLLCQDLDSNIELFEMIRDRFNYDMVVSPIWIGLMRFGAAEFGTVFQIEERQVPIPIEYPIKSIKDVEQFEVPQEPSGFLKMYFDISREVRRRYPDMVFKIVFDGAWDIAMLLRGDHRLPLDFRLYKDYINAENEERKEKIINHGNPELWPAIMELSTTLSTRHVQMAKEYGLNLMVAALIDQYAQVPVLHVDDYLTHVLPYTERVWKAHEEKMSIVYQVASPEEVERMLRHPVIGMGYRIGGLDNYIFPQDPNGVTLAAYDQKMLELAKENNTSYTYMIHGKFIRDATEEELENLVARVCRMAVEMKAKLIIMVISVPPGTDMYKLELIPDLVEKYGRY